MNFKGLKAVFGLGVAAGVTVLFGSDRKNLRRPILKAEDEGSKMVAPSGDGQTQPIPVRERKWEIFGKSVAHQGEIRKWDFNWDRRHFERPGRPGPVATRHLILVRHGQYNVDAENDEDRRLTAVGIKQATETGKRIRDLNLNLTYVVSSTMARAIETSRLIRKSLPDNVIVLPDDPVLEEGAPYPPEPGSVRSSLIDNPHNIFFPGNWRRRINKNTTV